ncbi:uncharacterized protein BX664DRAFT_334565 [Halteromyces radiatus]|uniref:uncharacterized protein n=1 Tax=Halteromyces radiatus TaxID=101107 RepID=UPI002220AC58|nr:uncharacterized protein BX664DRAFT_334565 [Halteromyces radiatus]KAI8090046.1 hypothetical protein BX664DRAFT_334565 [Halteromyces radiatus]
MTLLLNLPYEILILILSYIEKSNTIIQFLLCHPSFLYHYNNNNDFWHDLCTLHHIYYRHPCNTWKEMVLSEEMYQVCPHFHLSLFEHLSHKQALAFLSNMNTNYRYICLHYHCDAIVTNQNIIDSQLECSHPIGLRISPYHLFSIECTFCNRQLGNNDKLPSEYYLIQSFIRAFATPLTLNLNLTFSLFHHRRMIELSVFNRPGWSYIIEKSWYDEWLRFLRGDQSYPPGILNNKILFKDNSDELKEDRKLGIHFELVNNASRYYIELLYIQSGKIISEYDLQALPSYCKLLHDIHLYQQQILFRPIII